MQSTDTLLKTISGRKLMSNTTNVYRFLVLFIGVCGFSITPTSAQEPSEECVLCAEAEALVLNMGLREAPAPVRERDGWMPPKFILTVFPEQFVEQMRKVAPDAEVVSLQNVQDRKAAMERADVFIGVCTPELAAYGNKLKWIQLYSAGVDSCTAHPEFVERGVLVTNGQRLSGPQIGEHAIALTLALAHKLDVYTAEQATGQWERDILDDTQVIPAGLWELEGRTMLVAGLGGIGTQIARRAHGLGMRVIATRNSNREGPDYVDYVGLSHELSDLAMQADVVASALPLTDSTRGVFDSEFFGAMKDTAVFINVGRGETVVTDDLVAAIRAGQIAGAGLDVAHPEPLPPGHPLWSLPNVIMTPHIAASSNKMVGRIVTLQVENLRRYVAGDAMLSVVDLERGY
jgi:phosphoglycerate dehydrogenase-like enzyme